MVDSTDNDAVKRERVEDEKDEGTIGKISRCAFWGDEIQGTRTYIPLHFASEPPSKQQKVLETVDGQSGSGVAEGATEQADPPKEEVQENAGASASETKSPATQDNDPATSPTKVQLPTTHDDESAKVETAAEPTNAPVPAPAAVTVAQPTTLPPGLPPAMGATNIADATIEEKGTVSALYVGRVIGKGG